MKLTTQRRPKLESANVAAHPLKGLQLGRDSDERSFDKAVNRTTQKVNGLVNPVKMLGDQLSIRVCSRPVGNKVPLNRFRM